MNTENIYSEDTLSDDQKTALYLIEQHKNVFISGSAGTGKSYLLHILKKRIKNIHFTASTGVAAINIGGQTLHSWCGIGLGNLPLNKIQFSPKVINTVKNAKILAIDEISMISAEVFELVNDVLKYLRKNIEPFGGLQVILFGDFFQLPPVKGEYCFLSPIWKSLNLEIIILKKIFRQIDDTFIKLLDNIRNSSLIEQDIKMLADRVIKYDDDIKPVRLVSTKAQCDEINKYELSLLTNCSHTFVAKYFFTDSKKLELLKKDCLAYDILQLKIGSRVMMLRNTYIDNGVCNGSTGVVIDIETYPIVKFDNGFTTMIEQEVWTIERYDHILNKSIIEASMSQIPLIFAWSITIHKSQGLTFEKMSCNLSKVFTFGQSYVALSRVKSLEGLYVEDIDFSKIRTNQLVIDFYKKLNNL